MITPAPAAVRPVPELVDWFGQYVDRYVDETNGPDTDALIAVLDRVRDSYRYEAAAPAPATPTGAKALVRDGQIVISIDVDALPLILSGSIATNAVAGTYKVTDAGAFAEEVCRSLNDEREDGTTRVHMMFDGAFNHAIDQGAEGVEEIDEDEFEIEAARLAGAALKAVPPAEGGE